MNIKQKIISYIIGATLILSMIPIAANAETKTVEISETKGKKYVSLTELTNAYNGTIVDNSDINVMIYNLNGKVITVNSNTAFISIDNNLIPLETKEINGIIVPSLDTKKITTDNGEILIPVSIIENYFEIKCTDEGFNITITEIDEKEEESLPTTDTDSYESTSYYYYEDSYTETPEVYIEENKPNNNSSNSESSTNSRETSSDTSSDGSSSNNGQTTPQPEETPSSDQEPNSEEIPTPEQETDTEQTTTSESEQESNSELPESS